ncbi:MAG: hypothetical protein NUV77_09940 [Thermoguttaceae bacterium]|nr:hypothetical protein [Thermoguttaceae bacterium]
MNLSLCLGRVLVVSLGLAGAALGADVPPNSQNAPPKVVIPFDFESKWDQGRYGAMVGEMIWKKLSQEKRVVTTESMLDVRDLCSANGIRLGPETPLDKVRQVVRKDFDAQVGIWGAIERVPGTEGEVYDLVIKCYDFSGDQPRAIYEKSARTNSVSEVPHLYVREMLDRLCDRQPGAAPDLDPAAEERWKTGPNLVAGGDFEQGDRGVPVGWEPRGGQQREPLGNLVRWMPEVGNERNHVLRLTIPRAVAEAEGVMYYSKEFPIHDGATYRFQCRWRSTGPSPKVFIKCYDEIATEYRRQRPAAGKSADDGIGPGGSMNDPSGAQRREVYRSQQNLKGPNLRWNVHTQEFTPKHTRYSPKWGRVMLYGYLNEGVVEFDDVVIKEIVPAVTENLVRDKRHSLETKVTLEEMEENERRGNEARQKLRTERQAGEKKNAAKKRPAEE